MSPIIHLLIRFISSFRLSSVQSAPVSDIVNSHSSVDIHLLSFGSYTSGFFLDFVSIKSTRRKQWKDRRGKYLCDLAQ